MPVTRNLLRIRSICLSITFRNLSSTLYWYAIQARSAKVTGVPERRGKSKRYSVGVSLMTVHPIFMECRSVFHWISFTCICCLSSRDEVEMVRAIVMHMCSSYFVVGGYEKQ